MISGIPKTRDPWILYYWFVNELKVQGYDEGFILKLLGKPYVPRETCSSCGQAIPSQKVKHKEVFENVRWGKDKASGIVYPYSSFDPFIYEKTKAKPTKMTLEWEE